MNVISPPRMVGNTGMNRPPTTVCTISGGLKDLFGPPQVCALKRIWAVHSNRVVLVGSGVTPTMRASAWMCGIAGAAVMAKRELSAGARIRICGRPGAGLGEGLGRGEGLG